MVNSNDHDLINRYRISVSQITIDKFHMSQALPSSFIIHYQVCNYSSTTGPPSGEGTSYPSGETEFTPVLVGFLLLDLIISFLCIDF